MEPNDNKQLALQKAISSHEQALAGLTDLMNGQGQEKYGALVDRIKQNIAALQAEAAASNPDDVV